MMTMWQRCPVCDGHGTVAYPPFTPPAQPFVSSSCGPWTCHRCGGTGTILTPTTTEEASK
jgi:hypothetical protein